LLFCCVEHGLLWIARCAVETGRRFSAGAGESDRVRQTAAAIKNSASVLWVLRSVFTDTKTSERYSRYKSVHKRFSQWGESWVWDKFFYELVGDRKNQYLALSLLIGPDLCKNSSRRRKQTTTGEYGVRRFAPNDGESKANRKAILRLTLDSGHQVDPRWNQKLGLTREADGDPWQLSFM
jgi:hypothetical protein